MSSSRKKSSKGLIRSSSEDSLASQRSLETSRFLRVNTDPEETISDSPRISKRYELAAEILEIKADGEVRTIEGVKKGSDDTPAAMLMTYLRIIAERENLIPKSKRTPTRQTKTRRDLCEWVSSVCNDAEMIFTREGRSLEIDSPVYVIGDIRGNLRNVFVFDKNVWDKKPLFTLSKTIFLGNYLADENIQTGFGLECFLYLIACKVLNREKFYLLRGKFEEECPLEVLEERCVRMLGTRTKAPEIAEAIRKVLDVLPFYAIVDGSNLCVNSEIPSTTVRAEESSETLGSSSELGSEEELQQESYAEGNPVESNISLIDSKETNEQLFEEEALRFLTENGLDNVIRSHNNPPNGYQVDANGKIYTIVSSTDEPTGIFIDNETIQMLIFETK